MSPDSPLLVALCTAAMLGGAAVVAFCWDIGAGGRRVMRRLAALALCLVSTSAVAATEVNRLTETYPSWSSLVDQNHDSQDPGGQNQGGQDRGAQNPAARDRGSAVGYGRDSSARGGHAHPAAYVPVGGAGSTIEAFTVVGRSSGLTLTAYAYLPAGYAEQRVTYPVIEALHGYPGSPRSWLRRLDVQRHLDAEIAAGRMAPTIVVFPYQTTTALLDTECTNLVRGPQTETFLTVDVPAAVRARFRASTDRDGWALIGYSAGGFCATNLLLRHPDRYVAGASLSGYAAPGIAIGDHSESTTNNPAWRLRHLAAPSVGLYLGYAADDRHARHDALQLAGLARPPIAATTAVVPHGGHSDAVWQAMEAPAFDWLSGWLARPGPS